MTPTRLAGLRGERGQSLAEMALILPILLLLIMGIVDIGRAFHHYVVLENAAREGARYGSKYAWLDTNVPTIVRNEAQSNGLNPAAISVFVAYPTTKTIGEPIRVRAELIMNTIMGSLIGRSTITIRTETQMVIFAVSP